MGLIQKKDEKDEIDGIQIIERGEGPDGDEDEKIDLVAGTSAEHIAAGTTAEEEDARLEAQIAADAADENLMPEEQDEDDDSDADDHASKHKKTMIAAFVVAIVIAAVIGFFIGNGGFGGKGVGSATLTEDQLDSTVASYSYNGKKSDITAREAIESQYSLDTVKDSDGNYTAPSADVILSYVRNKILLDAAEDEGITVSSKEMKKYAEDSIGTSDYKTMATQYGVSKDQAKQIVRQSATLQKLYKKKVGDSSASMPTAPTEPADGNEEAASKDYADYIINLAGDEWDSEKGAWKDADSTYAKAFADDAFQFARSKVGDEANLFAYQFFRLIMLGNTRYDSTCFQSVVDFELKQFIRFRHFLTFKNGTYTDIQFREVVEFDVRADRISLVVGFFVCFLCIEQFLYLCFDSSVFDLLEQ